MPAGVWRQVWPAVSESVRELFQTSIDTGALPRQWRVAKIIPLKKPNKDDYTVAKAWRPISLLSTLGKLLEAVVAGRISFVVETYGLLPANHFGARKQRSAKQVLLLLQERIYSAWRSKKMVSLVSFDVKGAYNGVYKDRLLQRLAARGIPSDLVSWIGAFCSGRTATIVVNGQASAVRELEQAGLPQGSPLSPILFLFFNANLVQQRIDQNGGAIAFDYTAWVVGTTAAENMDRLNAIVQRATEWDTRSGASFEGDKTAFIHFTRNSRQSADGPIRVKGEEVRPTASVKTLGLILDARLRYQEHTARAATKGLQAAMALKRLRRLAVSDTQAVQRDGSTGGRLRIVCMDARQDSQRGEGAQASAEGRWTGSGRVLSDGRHGRGGGRSQLAHDSGTTLAKSAEDVGRPAQHSQHAPSCADDQTSGVQKVHVTLAKDRRVRTRSTDG